MDAKRVDVLIELNYKENEKIKISPIGNFKGLDGREFTVDEASISKTIENGVDLIVDVNHGFGSDGDKASGWIDINSIETRDDGVYASIKWTELGKELIDKRLYRYLSPAYVMDRNSADRRVLYFDSVGLVNRPNLLTKSLNNKTMEDVKLSEDEIKKTKEQNEKLEEKINGLGENLNTLKEENEKLRELNHKLSIDLALERNQILPAQVEFCKSLSEVQFGKFIESNSINVEGLKKETPAGGEIKRELNSLESKICEQLGIGGLQ